MIEFIFSFYWVLIVVIVAALVLTALPPPKSVDPRDVFGFRALKARRGEEATPPPLERYAARDGEQLAYRIYESNSDRVLIFIHGSSYHGGGYHALASAISARGLAKVVLPNLRGHYQSGRRRGDVDYIGQFEVDIVDLIDALWKRGMTGSITLGGHSSGGGLVIRFAGGSHRVIVSNFLALAPAIPVSPALRVDSGWSTLHKLRLYGLLILNALRIRGFNALPVIEFNKPVDCWDGTETLSYSHRLNASYHTRYKYADDIKGLNGKAFVLVGADDEAIDPNALRDLISAHAPQTRFSILPGINHFGVFNDPAAIEAIADWLGAPAAR